MRTYLNFCHTVLVVDLHIKWQNLHIMMYGLPVSQKLRLQTPLNALLILFYYLRTVRRPNMVILASYIA